MSSSSQGLLPASTASSSSAWDSLVQRSIAAWKVLRRDDKENFEEKYLLFCTDLDDFLAEGRRPLMFWFFQRREAFLSQKAFAKWSRDRLDDYILLPARDGFVSRTECFFVSHFWQRRDNPDPDGQCTRGMQRELESQHWSYIWVDWTCAPQEPRSKEEEAYFQRTLQTMSHIIRNCGFMWAYPRFEPRLWILFEIAEYSLTCIREISGFEDIKDYLEHVCEMQLVGVGPTLERYGYRCMYDHDRAFLTSWLELLILLKKLPISVDTLRRLMDNLTWFRSPGIMTVRTEGGTVEICRFDGTLRLNDKRYTFTPFPKLEEGGHFTNSSS